MASPGHWISKFENLEVRSLQMLDIDDDFELLCASFPSILDINSASNTEYVRIIVGDMYIDAVDEGDVKFISITHH